jgi:hypothetical protein
MGEGWLGNISLDKDESVCRALWHPLDGAPDVLLCTINLSVYEKHTSIREAFANLASAIAVNLDRPAGSAVTVQRMPTTRPAETKLDRQQFGCWTCTQEPQASNARYCLNAFSDEDILAKLSPAGLPMFCCKVATAGMWAMAR